MSRLSIYKASAGSGKTYLITLEYLRLLLQYQNNYRHILAVTFTKKAAAEMKDRVIGHLHKLASNQKTPYLPELIRSTNLSETEIREKAGFVLNRILHDYSRFYIETIDSFFQRIIRAFIREMGLQTGFAIELDNQKVLSNAIDLLFAEIDKKNDLKEWLLEFVEDNISKGRSWNLKKELTKFGQEIFREEYILTSSVKDVGNQNIKNLKRELSGIVASFEKALSSLTYKAFEISKSHNLTVEDFKYGKSGPAGYLEKIISGKYEPPGKRTIAAIGNDSEWFKEKSENEKRILSCLEAGLRDIMKEIISLYEKDGKLYHTAREVLKSINTLGLFTDITEKIRDYSNSENLFLLSNSSKLISGIIDENDSPFIYEKAGFFFRHFMIDEFQDTSRLQWNNFKPLLINALSENHKCLVVGDIKQSIYRWRNSDWTIMAEDIYKEFSNFGIEEITLPHNWRSKENIVGFNNELFASLPEIIKNKSSAIFTNDDGLPEKYLTLIEHVYSNVTQKIPDKHNQAGGHISLYWIQESEPEIFRQQALEKLPSVLSGLQKSGIKPCDIAILVRKNSEAREISKFLAEYKKNSSDADVCFDLISEESLAVSSSPAVKFIIAALNYLVDKEVAITNYLLVNEYKQYICGNDSVKALNNTDLFRFISEKIDSLNKYSSAYDLIECLVEKFNLTEKQEFRAFVNALADYVAGFANENSPGIVNFLQWWEEEGRFKTLPPNEMTNAIKLLTIHKSKGLEFKAVVLPFCNWPLTDNQGKQKILWRHTRLKPFSDFSAVPVPFSRELTKTVFSNDYFLEKTKGIVDNINLLYVAFTRASDSITAFFQLSAKTPDEEKIKNVGDLVRNMLQKPLPGLNERSPELFESFNESENKFEAGSIISDSKTSGISDVEMELIDSNIKYPLWRERIQIKSESEDAFSKTEIERNQRIASGKIMHELFRNIINSNDLENALTRMIARGLIALNETDEYRRMLEEVFGNEKVKSWFLPDWQVMVEKPILLGNGNSVRPDRVIIKDNRAIVIDYKFGDLKTEGHVTQVQQYIQNLCRMNYSNVEGFVWYVKTGEIIEVTV